MNLFYKLLCLLISVTLISCDKDDSRLEEVSGIQGQKNAEKQIEEENKNLALKAEKMELELKKRANFYQSLIGDYLGTVIILGQKSFIELSIQQNYMPAPTDRVRTLEEISYDLSQISLSVLFKHYSPNSNIVAVTCQMDLVRPDINTGKLILASDDCPNFYQLGVSENPEPQIDSSDEQEDYALTIYSSADQPTVPFLKGYVNPGSTPGRFELILKRISDESTER